MLILVITCAVLIGIMATVSMFIVVTVDNNTRVDGWHKAGVLFITIMTAALTAVAVSMAIPDRNVNPLEDHLPADWRSLTEASTPDETTLTAQFTPEAQRKAETNRRALQAVQTKTAVKAYARVTEYDRKTYRSVLQHHIRQGGGHVTKSNTWSVIATVPKSYLPCLEQATTTEPTKETTPQYRKFASEAIGERHQCPYRNGNAVDRVVHIQLLEEPLGIANRHFDRVLSTMIAIILTAVNGAIMAATIAFADRPKNPQPQTA